MPTFPGDPFSACSRIQRSKSTTTVYPIYWSGDTSHTVAAIQARLVTFMPQDVTTTAQSAEHDRPLLWKWITAPRGSHPLRRDGNCSQTRAAPVWRPIHSPGQHAESSPGRETRCTKRATSAGGCGGGGPGGGAGAVYLSQRQLVAVLDVGRGPNTAVLSTHGCRDERSDHGSGMSQSGR